MSFATRWRVPTPAFTPRWRGPEGALEAVAAAPETPLSAFVVPPAGGGAAADWASITGKPSTFAPSAHGHVIADVTGLQAALDAKQPLSATLTATTAAFTTAQQTKLAGIAEGATANATDSALRDRSTHTGQQAASTITGLAAVATSGAYSDLTDRPSLFNGAYGSLTGVPSTFAPSAHGHVIADITGLQAALDAKANAPVVGIGPHAMEPGLAAGDYFSAAINAASPSTIAAAAGRLEFCPIRPGRNVTVDQLSLEVTTLIAGSQARVGIYSAHPVTGLPDALLTGQGSLLDCATTGFKTSAISPALLLEAGNLYWIAVHSSSTQTYRGIVIAALMPLPQTQTVVALNTSRRATVTFGSLPATAPASILVSALCPLVRLRVA